MCGICGMAGGVDAGLLRRMVAALRHRGPDDQGSFLDPVHDVALGHTRLAIIDPTPDGRQPMSAAEDQVWCVYNGEIYNYVELRQELAGGAPFKTASDTEVLLRAYLAWGRKCLDRLNGMFAFALWDRRDATLWLARDRLGIKPLYYSILGARLRFASEVRCILSDPSWPRAIDVEAVDDFLRRRYVRQPATLIRGVRALAAGTSLLWRKGGAAMDRYWTLDWEREARRDPAQAEEAFHELLDDAMRLQLRSDVPLGVFLSGGMDSSTLAALAAERTSGAVRTFCVGFRGVEDERRPAAAVATHFRTDHVSFECGAEDLRRLPEVVEAMDMPIGDAVIVPTYLLSENARRSVKTVLSGEGADELLAGYAHQRQLARLAGWGRVVGAPGVRHLLQVATHVLPLSFWDRFFAYGKSLGRAGVARLRDLLDVVGDPARSYQTYTSLCSERERGLLYRGELRPFASSSAPPWPGRESAADPLRRLLRVELESWLPGNILTKQDGLTMAHGLEARVPFLDHRLVEEAISWSRGTFARLSRGKEVLAAVLRRRGFVRTPRRKVPFMLEIAGAYQGVLLELLEERLFRPDARLRDLVDLDVAREWKRELPASPLVRGKQLVALLVLELWLKRI